MCINDSNSPGLSTLFRAQKWMLGNALKSLGKCNVVVFHITVPGQGVIS